MSRARNQVVAREPKIDNENFGGPLKAHHPRLRRDNSAHPDNSPINMLILGGQFFRLGFYPGLRENKFLSARA